MNLDKVEIRKMEIDDQDQFREKVSTVKHPMINKQGEEDSQIKKKC